MFRQKVMGVAARGVRFNSTSAYTAKATSMASSVTAKVSSLVKSSTYWSKVSLELAKQVYIKEGFAPPSGAQFKQVYNEMSQCAKTLYKRYSENPKELVERAKAFNKQDAYKYGSITVQLFGMFALGEMIGRRHIVDYPHH